MVNKACKDEARSVSKMKKTEIGVIPEDWEVDYLSNLTNRIGDGIHSTPIYSDNDDFYFINGNNLGNGFINFDKSTKTVSSEQYKLHKRDLNDNTILLSINGTIGNIAYYRNEPIILGKSACYINLKNSLNKKFIFYILQSKHVQKYFEDNLTGSTIKNLGLGTISNTQIPLPPLAEQEAIATALSDADAWIDSLEQLIAKKRLIKQGAMQTLLTHKEDWEVKKLGEVCDVRDGTHDSPKYLDSGVKFITSKNIVNNKLDFSDISYISFSDATEINKRSKVDKDDIIMSMIGTIGNAVLIDFEPDFCIKNVALLKPKNISSIFLIQMIKSPYFQNLLNSKMDGGIQKFVSLGVLRDLDFNCPKSLSEQERIARILSDMDAELEALEAQLAKARQIKQGMMQELLTGRTRLV